MDLELSTAHTRRGGLRRRTRKACVRCNGRKVRCDVDWSTHKPGSQCTNCRLDGEKCVLREGIRNRQENLISAFMPRERNYDGFSDHRIGVVSRRQFEPEFYEIDRLGMLGKGKSSSEWSSAFQALVPNTLEQCLEIHRQARFHLKSRPNHPPEIQVPVLKATSSSRIFAS